MKTVATKIPTNLATNSLIILFFPFIRDQKKESSLQQVGSLVTRNISAFYLNRVAPYFGAMFKSKEFFKGILLYVIIFRIIVSCLQGHSRIKYMCKARYVHPRCTYFVLMINLINLKIKINFEKKSMFIFTAFLNWNTCFFILFQETLFSLTN